MSLFFDKTMDRGGVLTIKEFTDSYCAGFLVYKDSFFFLVRDLDYVLLFI